MAQGLITQEANNVLQPLTMLCQSSVEPALKANLQELLAALTVITTALTTQIAGLP